MYALSKEAALATYEQYKEKFEMIWKKCTILLCGVGVRGPHCFQREEKLLSEEDLRELDDLEAVGDLYGRWFDLNGNYLACSPNQRVISILPEIQKLIPRRVLISFGKEKITAIDILLKNSMANILISDELTAKKLFAHVRLAKS
jgi:DNA-binding transcriptional regulator LsrR (DeoR family)